MTRLGRENFLYMILTIVLIVSGYWFLRYAYQVADHAPFSQEIVLVILGTIVTIFITAILLNKQTEVELRKEENIKFIELKTEIYVQLMDHLERIIRDGHVSHDNKITLRMLAHKLAIVASSDVLVQFKSFINKFTTVTDDAEVSAQDVNILMDELAMLSIHIRKDLIGDLDIRHGIDRKRLEQQILDNSDALED